MAIELYHNNIKRMWKLQENMKAQSDSKAERDSIERQRKIEELEFKQYQ